jgi:hypothetical protein
MGRIARVIENIKNRVNMNLGGFFDNECDRVQPAGDDSRPLPDDDGYAEQWGNSGRWVSLGYFDYANKVASPGEKRIYGRDENGAVTSHVYLMNDGTIEIKNDIWMVTYNPDGTKTETNGPYNESVASDGTVNINGFIIGPDGAASSPVSMTAPTGNFSTSLQAGGKEQIDHDHGPGTYNVSGSPVSGTSGENN